MGMYDTVVPEQALRCPNCGGALADFQTKEFTCLLEVYRVGDRMPKSVRDGAYPIYTICGDTELGAGCGSWIDAKAQIAGGLLEGVDCVTVDRAQLRDANRRLGALTRNLARAEERIRALEDRLVEVQRERVAPADLRFLQDEDIPRSQVVAVGRLQTMEYEKFNRRSGRWVRYNEIELRTPSGNRFSLGRDAPLALLAGAPGPGEGELLSEDEE